jgi:pSer/pThr/pTyr-binding forkhead associated (FHA) protein
MTNGTKGPDASAFPEDGEARADAIEERIERLRRLKGWASETRVLPAAEVQAAAATEEPAPAPATTKMTLRFSHGADVARVVDVDKDHFDVGSGEMARLRILDPTLSARHCRISRDGNAFRVRDLNSQSGTFVNDARIPLSSALGDGDTLRCGAVTFTVGVTDSAAPANAEPVESTMAADLGAAVARADEAPVPPGGKRPTISEESMAGKAPPSDPPVDVPEERHEALAFLLYFDEAGLQGQVLIPRDQTLSVGRKAAAALRLVDHGISGVHAAFGWEDGQLVVRDLGSTNGTWYQGERVSQAALVDDDVVRLGLLPLRVRIFEANAEPPIAHDASPLGAPLPAESGAPWTLVYRAAEPDGAGTRALGAMTLSGRDPCVVVGSGPVELVVSGLMPEHLQFDWSDGGLSLTLGHRSASCSVQGAPCRAASLSPGDRIEAAEVMSLIAVAGALRARPVEGEARRWAGHLRQADASLELLFVEPDASGGRVELALWGDGAMTLDLHGGDGAHDRLGGQLQDGLRQALVDSFICAGFPVGAGEATAGGPELHAFRSEERATVYLTRELLATPQWHAAYRLLRAIIELATT